MKQIFVNGLGSITPQWASLPECWPDQPVVHPGPLIRSADFNYKDYLNPLSARRLSRIIRMALSASVMASRDAGIQSPEAVITGTGLGCVEDTEKFLTTLVENQESLLNPTHFIQSTYNTISSQIAIMLKASGYNSTYVHRAFSFESALADAIDLILTGEVADALVAGIDEITESHHQITALAGDWKKEDCSSQTLLRAESAGSMPGEGACVMVLAGSPGKKCYGRIVGVRTLFGANETEVHDAASALLAQAGIKVSELSLILAGYNGDNRYDKNYCNFISRVSDAVPVAAYKHLCGEYFTSSAFAAQAALLSLHTGNVAPYMMLRGKLNTKPEHILFYNRHQNIEHSLMLFSRA